MAFRSKGLVRYPTMGSIFFAITILSLHCNLVFSILNGKYEPALGDGDRFASANFILGACEESIQPLNNHNRPRRIVAIPSDPTRRSYAPLCSDGKHIDSRRIQSCNEGSCWSEQYNSCTFECTWRPPTPAPTSPPTAKPTIGLELTTHPVRLVFKNVPPGYRFTDAMRSSILVFLRNLLIKHLDEGFELVELSYAGGQVLVPDGSRRGRQLRFSQRRRLDTLYLPFRAVVRGPPEISDLALGYIMQVVRTHIVEIADYIKSIDGEVFVNLNVNSIDAEIFDLEDVVETLPPTSRPSNPPTGRPTKEPTTMPPTEPPTNYPSVPKFEIKSSTAEETEESDGFPWWAWLIIALVVILLFCCCLLIFCFYWRSDKEEQQQENLVVQQHFHNDWRQTPRNYVEQDDESDDYNSRQSKSRSRRYEHIQKQLPPKRKSSQTVVEDDEREQKCAGQYDDDDQNSEHFELVPVNSYNSSDCSGVVSAVPIRADPPEDNALVLYSSPSQDRTDEGTDPYGSRSVAASRTREDPSEMGGEPPIRHDEYSYGEEPNGKKIPKTTSVFASDVGAMDTFSTSAGEEPTGKKISRATSVFASDLGADAFSTSTGEEPNGMKIPKKKSMYVRSRADLQLALNNSDQHYYDLNRQSSSDRSNVHDPSAVQYGESSLTSNISDQYRPHHEGRQFSEECSDSHYIDESESTKKSSKKKEEKKKKKKKKSKKSKIPSEHKRRTNTDERLVGNLSWKKGAYNEDSDGESSEFFSNYGPS